MFDINYLNHNFILYQPIKNDDNNRCSYYICNKCNVEILCYYIKENKILHLHSNYINLKNNLLLMTCEEEIIKFIIE